MRLSSRKHDTLPNRFNPRIRKGCDYYPIMLKHIPVSFNPRIRKGCDFKSGLERSFVVVSIHASVKDATLYEFTINPSNNGFNPRIRKGCDLINRISQTVPMSFNPRIRKGCDYFRELFQNSMRGFNPRIRKGCDKNVETLFVTH